MRQSILVGSKNPVKITAAQRALSQWFSHCHFEAVGQNAPSLVADQPMSEDETRLGAINRVEYCLDWQRRNACEYDWTLAYEGGVELFTEGPCTFAYVAISNGCQLVVGRSGNLAISTDVYTALTEGQELGHVMDSLYNTENIKQKGGAIGLLTRGLASRQSVYVLATIMAMSRFEATD